MALVGARRAPESVVRIGAFRVTFADCRGSFRAVRRAVVMSTAVVLAVTSLLGGGASAQGPVVRASGTSPRA